MPGRLFRNHPLLVATSAASGGVLLGAYVAFQIFAAPVEQRGPGQPSPPQPISQANADTKAPAIATETTGAAPASDDVAAADRCQGQTWPNLTRDCMDQMQSRKPARTVTTDRVEKPAPETQSAPQASSGTAVANAPAIAPSSEPAPAAQPASTQTVAAPPPAAAPANPPDVASAKPAKSEKRKVKEAKRKAKNPKREQGDDRVLAYAPNGDRDDEQFDRTDRNDRRSLRVEDREGRLNRSRRERVIVRDGDDDGDRVSERGDRRVIVIRRDRDGGGGFGDGGIFGSLFGN